MVDSRFFHNHGPIALGELARLTGCDLHDGVNADSLLLDVAPLDRATHQEVSFFDNTKYLEQFQTSNAGACFVREKYISQAPTSTALLISADPYRCYALAAQAFYPTLTPTAHTHTSAVVDPTAVIGAGVSIAAGAVIEAHVEIADGVSIGANSVIGRGVVIGKNTVIGPLCGLSHCYIGEDVLLHRGVQIGQDGFGFSLGRDGHVKVPQLGRVIVHNSVEIGANTTIDRGTGPDTVIHEGVKIDNLVQIGHNVQIGKAAVIIAQVGISGSTRIGDGAVLAGQAGVSGHIKIGPGVKVAAKSGVMHDVPAGASVGGFPAVNIKDWHRQTIALTRLVKQHRGSHGG
jgi:UDP-3-O-[3-hydroxymyristoyl] glucosamine N-acyltransferase